MAQPHIFTGSSSTHGEEFAKPNKIRGLILQREKQTGLRKDKLCVVTVTQTTGGRGENQSIAFGNLTLKPSAHLLLKRRCNLANQMLFIQSEGERDHLSLLGLGEVS